MSKENQLNIQAKWAIRDYFTLDASGEEKNNYKQLFIKSIETGGKLDDHELNMNLGAAAMLGDKEMFNYLSNNCHPSREMFERALTMSRLPQPNIEIIKRCYEEIKPNTERLNAELHSAIIN